MTSLSLFTFMHWRRKWQPTPVFLPGESQGRGSWWAAIYGVPQSWIRLRQLSNSSSRPFAAYNFKLSDCWTLKDFSFLANLTSHRFLVQICSSSPLHSPRPCPQLSPLCSCNVLLAPPKQVLPSPFSFQVKP